MMKFSNIIQIIKKSMPDIELKLRQARIRKEPDTFIKELLKTSSIISVTITSILFFFAPKINPILYFLTFMMSFTIVFFYFSNSPSIFILKQKKLIDQEIVFAGRFLSIEIEAGIDLYSAMRNISGNFPNIGRYFREITDNIDLGTGIDEAMDKAIIESPSENLSQILHQIINSLRSGSDIHIALGHTIDKIAKEQHIEVKMFAKKLNPLAMFYLIGAVVFPSLGVTMVLIVASLMGLSLTIWVYLLINMLVIIIQIMFLGMINSVKLPIYD